MNDLEPNSRCQPATTKPSIEPALRAAIPLKYTDEQVEAASRPPSLESIFEAHLKLLQLQDTDWRAVHRRALADSDHPRVAR